MLFVQEKGMKKRKEKPGGRKHRGHERPKPKPPLVSPDSLELRSHPVRTLRSKIRRAAAIHLVYPFAKAQNYWQEGQLRPILPVRRSGVDEFRRDSFATSSSQTTAVFERAASRPPGRFESWGSFGGRGPWRIEFATGTYVSGVPFLTARSIKPPRLMSPRPANSEGNISFAPKIPSSGSTYFCVATLPSRTTSLRPIFAASLLASRSRGSR